jgi:N-hydroxyarylamine O-acetyltransferase
MELPGPPDDDTIGAYLHRIGFAGDPSPDLATLTELHRRHIRSIPYDALDVQLGRPVSLDPRDAFRKLVMGRRGGWCFEMNGLIAWILEGLGFQLMRVGASVERADDDDIGTNGHLIMLVDVPGQPEPFVADVGFGEGPHEPYRLRAGSFVQTGATYRLTELPGGWWRVICDTVEMPYFDFRAQPADAAQMTEANLWLQREADSPFVRTAVVARGIDDGCMILRGRVLQTLRPAAVEKTIIESADAYRALLHDRFDIDLPDVDALWARIVARHEELFGPDRIPEAD